MPGLVPTSVPDLICLALAGRFPLADVRVWVVRPLPEWVDVAEWGVSILVQPVGGEHYHLEVRREGRILNRTSHLWPHGTILPPPAQAEVMVHHFLQVYRLRITGQLDDA